MPWNPSPKNKKSASSQIGLQVCVLPSSKNPLADERKCIL